MNDTTSAFHHSLDLGRLITWRSRTCLTVKQQKSDFSIWSFIKQCIGKDLTRISMPVVLNEPISFLQRLAECMEYSELLLKAVEQTDAIRRMEYVCAFAVSALSSNFNRTSKPFNPLLGETYEYHQDGYIFVAEQVSHHPPISAFHVESIDYRLNSTVQFKLRFWGQSIEVQPKGHLTLILPKYDEVYTWPHPNLVVHNILTGKLWLEYVEKIEVTNHTSPPITGQLEFKTYSCDSNHVFGQIQTSKSSTTKPIRSLFGDWSKGLFSVDPCVWASRASFPNSNGSNQDSEFGFIHPLHEQRCLWLSNHHPPNSCEFYNFTRFTCGLNELDSTLTAAKFSSPNADTVHRSRSFLPPTDCRNRPDIRALELGSLDVAASEKERLEEKQRSVRRTSQSVQSNLSNCNIKFIRSSHSSHSNSVAKPKIGPVWFIRGLNKATNEQDWLFSGAYWFRNWAGYSPDLF